MDTRVPDGARRRAAGRGPHGRQRPQRAHRARRPRARAAADPHRADRRLRSGRAQQPGRGDPAGPARPGPARPPPATASRPRPATCSSSPRSGTASTRSTTPRSSSRSRCAPTERRSGARPDDEASLGRGPGEPRVEGRDLGRAVPLGGEQHAAVRQLAGRCGRAARPAARRRRRAGRRRRCRNRSRVSSAARRRLPGRRHEHLGRVTGLMISVVRPVRREDGWPVCGEHHFRQSARSSRTRPERSCGPVVAQGLEVARFVDQWRRHWSPRRRRLGRPADARRAA